MSKEQPESIASTVLEPQLVAALNQNKYILAHTSSNDSYTEELYEASVYSAIAKLGLVGVLFEVGTPGLSDITFSPLTKNVKEESDQEREKGVKERIGKELHKFVSENNSSVDKAVMVIEASHNAVLKEHFSVAQEKNLPLVVRFVEPVDTNNREKYLQEKYSAHVNKTQFVGKPVDDNFTVKGFSSLEELQAEFESINKSSTKKLRM